MAHFARKANSAGSKAWRLALSVRRAACGVLGYGFGRVTLPRDRRSTSIKREHAHKRGNEG